ncbi:TBC1D12 [Symbiodinium natans]|uniref:TBC1D12 protein n=1 Tax=Symbiodinium natans TaxID=878477 RepID=A0A812K8E5_9DINO|nr:TBC1D12 [Symbiodinium natans]
MSQPADQALDYTLKTYAFGLLPQRSSQSDLCKEDMQGLEDWSHWSCVPTPTEIPGAPGFTTLAGGEDGCLGITPEGDVHRWVAASNTGKVARGFAMEWSLTVLKDEAGQKLQLRDVALGFGHGRTGGSRIAAIALMDSGDVFSSQAWYADGGDGSEGSRPLACPDWRQRPGLHATLVVSVACGGGFCAALTARGELLAWGESDCGALGLGDVQRAEEPSLVQGELARRRVAVVACGESHMVAASFDEESAGAVYTWGCGQHGRLGYEATSQSLPHAVPWLTEELGDVLSARLGQKTQEAGPALRASPPPRPSRRLPQRITQASCGLRHTALICQGGLVCFGADDYGQLGRAGEEEMRPKLPPFAHCPKLEAPGDVRTKEACARRISCGPLHTAAVCSQGRVHVWGIDLRQTKDLAKAPRSGPQPVLEFGPERPVVALACGAHFIVCSAEVALPRLDPERSCVSQEDLLLGYCADTNAGAGVGSLTSWRPAHLPPKAEEESEHHRNLVRALERNVQRRLVQEQREEQQRRQREERREQRLKEHTDIWLHELLPGFVPGMEPSQRMQRLWRQGLPPRVREVIWPVAIGNVLRITPELFEIHKQRAVDARKAQETASNVLITLTDAPPTRGREQSTTCIPFDLPRTFPTLAFFSEGGPLHEDCARILEAYTFYRPDIGYVQGMSYLAAMLLLYLPPYQSFVGLCNLLNTPSVLGLYRLEPRAVACRARVFEQLCSQQLPAVSRCIQQVGLMPEMFLIEWFLTVFAKCLTVDVASVVWDLFLLDGEVVLYCTAIAILRILEFQLLHPDGRRGMNAAQPDLESCTRVLNEELRNRVSDPDELLWHIAQVRRRAPQRIFGEIRDIENMEFGSQGRVSTRGSITNALRSASFFAAAKDHILSRLLP